MTRRGTRRGEGEDEDRRPGADADVVGAEIAGSAAASSTELEVAGTDPTSVLTLTEVLGADEEDADASTKRVQGWGRVFRGNRMLWISAIVAVVALVAGLLVGKFVLGPNGSGDAPDAGLPTVPVEYGELSNDVTIRADVGYADAVDVTLDTGSVEGSAVVTGQVPETGAELNPLSIALEVTGRPVIVLPGELPSYRTLRYGVSGPDVLQLKQALVSVGLNPGDAASNLFDQSTADAVAQLYAQVGYPAPTPADGAEDSYRSAQEGVRSAEQAVASAQKELGTAGAGASAVEIRQADNAVSAAQRDLDDAKAAQQSGSTIANLEDALALAQLQRSALNERPDVSAQNESLAAAQQQLAAAQEDAERARQDTLAYLPSSEVLYLTDLPRRVDSVNVTRGAVLQGAAMTVSGATVRLTGTAAEADARLLAVGGTATFELADGTEQTATVTEIAPGEKKDSTRWQVILEPAPLTPEQMQQIQGSNVRLQIPVGATEGKVLSVPLAALTAGPGGESRVEVVDSDPRDGDKAETHLVVVETGLAAKGAVEVTPVDGELEEGDLVVVGE